MTDRRDPEAMADALDQLRRAGRSIGSTAFASAAGGLVWVVSGHNGKNAIRAEGATGGGAWGGALTQARGVGMLGRWRVPGGAG
jgi:uncharacterized protein YcfJ